MIAPLLAALVVIFRFGGNYHEGPWLGAAGLFILWIGWRIWERFSLPPALLVTCLLLHSSWLYLMPNLYDETGQVFMAIKWQNAESAMKLLAFIFLSLELAKRRRWVVRESAHALCLLFFFWSSGKAIFEWGVWGCSEVNSCGGALANPSLNASLLVVIMPIVAVYLPRWLVVSIAALVVLVGKTNLGLGLLAIYAGSEMLNRCPKFLILLPVLVLAAHLTHGDKILLSSGDRFPMWQFFLESWSANKLHWIFGTGFGSFPVFSLILQEQFQMRSQYWWPWAHNDWLQMLFEAGVPGLVLMAWTFGAALLGLLRKGFIPEFQSLLMLGAACFVNYPLHLAAPCALAAWLLSLGLARKNVAY